MKKYKIKLFHFNCTLTIVNAITPIKKISFPHLFSADDQVLFGEATIENAKTMRSIL